MPWNVRKGYGRCGPDQFAVVNTQTGQVRACHTTREKAQAQVDALYANVPEARRAVSDKPWSQFTAADYSPAQWRRACLIDTGQGEPDSKARYKLPVREPGGALNRNACHAAASVLAGGRGGVQASPEQKRAAARRLAAIYRNDLGEDPPEALVSMAARAAPPAFAGPALLLRSFPLEDIRILSRAQGSEYADGRTVEAYAAVFDIETEIRDFEGHYKELNDPAAFNRTIENARPKGSRAGWQVGVFYNHGMTIHGTPSDRFSVPLGSPVEIRAEKRGLLTITRYNQTPLAEEILEAINSGDITGQSYVGRIIRSDPRRPPAGGHRRGRDGSLTVVRRLELGLKEYGPTPFPAYVDAAVVNVRSLLAGLGLPFLSATPEETIEQLTDAGYTPEEAEQIVAEDPAADGTSAPDAEPAADDPPPTPTEETEGHSSRHDQLVSRIRDAYAAHPWLARTPMQDRATEITRSGEKGPEA